jgi:hypothetical protein
MAAKKPKHPSPKTWRPTPEDQEIMQDLRAKLGVSDPAILRLAVRKLAEHEGLRQ